MAIGGSTNTVLHLPAIANEIGIDLPLNLFDEKSREIPQLLNLRPGGMHFLRDFDDAGGIPALHKQLRSKLNLDCETVSGKRISKIIDESFVKDTEVIRNIKNPR